MNNHITVARIHHVLSILYFLIGILVALAFFGTLASPSDASGLMAVVACLMLGMAFFHRSISKGARQRAPWARTCSNGIAALMLLGFPLGTAIGIYLLLNQDWSGRPKMDESQASKYQEKPQPRDGSGWFESILSGLNKLSDQASTSDSGKVSLGNVIQRGGQLDIYDQNGRHIRTSGIGLNCHLTGYTSSTYSVRNGNVIYTYNAQGRQISTTSAI